MVNVTLGSSCSKGFVWLMGYLHREVLPISAESIDHCANDIFMTGVELQFPINGTPDNFVGIITYKTTLSVIHFASKSYLHSNEDPWSIDLFHHGNAYERKPARFNSFQTIELTWRRFLSKHCQYFSDHPCTIHRLSLHGRITDRPVLDRHHLAWLLLEIHAWPFERHPHRDRPCPDRRTGVFSRATVSDHLLQVEPIDGCLCVQ
jgi:hypothetical protein